MLLVSSTNTPVINLVWKMQIVAVKQFVNKKFLGRFYENNEENNYMLTTIIKNMFLHWVYLVALWNMFNMFEIFCYYYVLYKKCFYFDGFGDVQSSNFLSCLPTEKKQRWILTVQADPKQLKRKCYHVDFIHPRRSIFKSRGIFPSIALSQCTYIGSKWCFSSLHIASSP